MGALSIIKAGDLAIPPVGLDAYGRFAWKAAIDAIGPLRGLNQADLLSLEAACRAWSRWKALEERIAEGASDDDELGGEIVQIGGKTVVTTLRAAADKAFGQWKEIASSFGIAFPALRDKVPTLDLFGLPERAGRGQRGRPAYAPTIQDRNRVRLLLALGWSNQRIASALEITPPTLHKYFKVELAARDHMRDRLDARRFEIAAEQMNSGNIAALRELNKMVEASDRLESSRRLTGSQEDEDEKSGRDGRNSSPAARRGKKEVAEEEAREAGGDGTGWGNLLNPGGFEN